MELAGFAQAAIHVRFFSIVLYFIYSISMKLQENGKGHKTKSYILKSIPTPPM